jgi:hypothetical protein
LAKLEDSEASCGTALGSDKSDTVREAMPFLLSGGFAESFEKSLATTKAGPTRGNVIQDRRDFRAIATILCKCLHMPISGMQGCV